MSERVHVIISEHPGMGWSVESPQLPELVAGRSTRLEVGAAIGSILEFGGLKKGASVVLHDQSYFTTEDGKDYAIRVRRDQKTFDERMKVLRVLLSTFEVPETPYPDDAQETGLVPVFVTSLYSDTVADLLDQMDERGDLIVVALPFTDRGVWTTSLIGDPDPQPGVRTLADWGINREMKLSQLITKMESTPARERTVAV